MRPGCRQRAAYAPEAFRKCPQHLLDRPISRRRVLDVYSSIKLAVEGLSEALHDYASPGTRVTVVEPYFRTKFLNASSLSRVPAIVDGYTNRAARVHPRVQLPLGSNTSAAILAERAVSVSTDFPPTR
ncbi:Short-chain dehydrogenase/reductase SDR (fragment) [Agrobacterium tumefaciens str. Kerr 14]|uniref:Short-chain dehydrogenase/reductase SDR n=1 Tax=Agrobacterium tumefaciens str. Kerr 14 TaxID=1183424 RepID=A0A1S7SCB7_AGRTU